MSNKFQQIIREEKNKIISLLSENHVFQQTCKDENGPLFSDATEMAYITGFGNDEQSYTTGAEKENLISRDLFLSMIDLLPQHKKLLNKNNIYFGRNEGILWFYDANKDIHYFYA